MISKLKPRKQISPSICSDSLDNYHRMLIEAVSSREVHFMWWPQRHISQMLVPGQAAVPATQSVCRPPPSAPATSGLTQLRRATADSAGEGHALWEDSTANGSLGPKVSHQLELPSSWSRHRLRCLLSQ